MGGRNMVGQWVVFQVNGQEYALSVDQVIEVLRMASLTPVAEAPVGFAGILNLRGYAVPVLDMVQRLAGLKRSAGLDQAIVVVQMDGRLVGLVVDAVDEVVTLDEASVRPPDKLLGDKNLYLGVARWNQRVILLVDVERLVRNESSAGGLLTNHFRTVDNSARRVSGSGVL